MPADATDIDLDGLAVQDVIEGPKGQRQGRVLLVDGLGEARGQPGVVEGRLLLLRRRVDQDEVVAAGHRAPVPEAVRSVDPGRRFGHTHGEALQTLADSRGAPVILERALGDGRPGHEENGRC